MTQKVFHQFTEGMYQGDAVSDHVLLIQGWLHEMGYQSEIYATQYETAFNDIVTSLNDYRRTPEEKCIIYHHAVGSDMADWIMKKDLPRVLIYHNITPPEFYQTSNPSLSAQLQKGREQLVQLRPQTPLALADSAYNEIELKELGYGNTAVLPIVLQESDYDHPLDQDLLSRMRINGPTLLFVGRAAPNKKQEDLITLLYAYQRLEPRARLIIIGSLQNDEYVTWLKEYARSLGLPDESLFFTGHVSQQELVTYYSLADLYISMSEHEGFGKPLIESMYFNLPVLAYSSTAVPYTMGDAGVMFLQKDFEALAEAANILITDSNLRQRIIQKQKERVQTYLAVNVKSLWQQLVEQLQIDIKNYH